MRDHLETFTTVYRKQIWGNGSGSGSSAKYNRKYIEFLERFIATNKIANVIDFGCGDWQFSKEVDWSGVKYVGVDVVESVIDENIERYAKDNISFVCDGIQDVREVNKYLGKERQLVLLKDVLQHWSDDELLPWLESFINLEFDYAIVTNGYKHWRCPKRNGSKRNIDNEYSYAPLDLLQEPFKKFGFVDALYYRYKKAMLYDNTNGTTKTAKDNQCYSRCPYCASPLSVVQVHGHSQCAACKTNVQPCCDGTALR